MTTGHERKPLNNSLSERLQANMQASQHEADALIASAMQSFTSGIKATLNDAQATIANDLQRFTSNNRRNLKRIDWMSRYTPWIVMGLVVAIPSAIVGLSWHMAGLMVAGRLEEMGLTIHRTSDRTLILLNPQTAKIIACNRHDKCLEIKD